VPLNLASTVQAGTTAIPVPAERQDRYPSAPRARSSKPSISRRRRTGSPSTCPVPTSGTSPRGGGAGGARPRCGQRPPRRPLRRARPTRCHRATHGTL